MSAFICSNAHITALAVYATKHGLTKYSTNAVAKSLFAQNVASVNHRYNETNNVKFRMHKGAANYEFSPVQIIKAAQCLDYQSCELDDWQDTFECLLLNEIVTHALATLGKPADSETSFLPGYHDAQWEIRTLQNHR
jgi:hypothetical protein